LDELVDDVVLVGDLDVLDEHGPKKRRSYYRQRLAATRRMR